MFVQDAFPTMPADKREQLLTGTHPGCWIKIFSHPFDGPNLEGFCDECGETIEHPYHAEDDMAAEWIEANNPSPDFDI